MALALLAFWGIGAEWFNFATLLYFFAGFFLAAAGAVFAVLFIALPPYSKRSFALGLGAGIWNAVLMALQMYLFMPR